VWPRRPALEGSLEIQLESRIKSKGVVHHMGHMDFVVTFGVDLAETNLR
jgi:hypothetical protein